MRTGNHQRGEDHKSLLFKRYPDLCLLGRVIQNPVSTNPSDKGTVNPTFRWTPTMCWNAFLNSGFQDGPSTSTSKNSCQHQLREIHVTQDLCIWDHTLNFGSPLDKQLIYLTDQSQNKVTRITCSTIHCIHGGSVHYSRQSHSYVTGGYLESGVLERGLKSRTTSVSLSEGTVANQSVQGISGSQVQGAPWQLQSVPFMVSKSPRVSVVLRICHNNHLVG